MMKKTITVDRILIKIGDDVVGRIRKSKVVLEGENRGRLLDGREVVKIGNEWFYLPMKTGKKR